MAFIAWVPARGGSKRLPGKNLKNFNGYPLIYYSIDIALKCPSIDRIIVSSDDQKIISYSQTLGVETVERPSEYSNDLSSVGSAAHHTCAYLGISNETTDGLVTLQPTQPLRSVNMVEAAINQFKSKEECDSAFGVSLNEKKIGFIVSDKFDPLNFTPEQRSQDMKRTYYENGAIYITKPSKVLNEKKIFDTDSLPIICDKICGLIDIDDTEDFNIAERIFHLYKPYYDEETIY